MALNGAVMMGTYDGANLDISEDVGTENLFLFGLKSAEVLRMRQERSYRPSEICDREPRIQRLVKSFSSGLFCPHQADFGVWVSRTLLSEEDEQMHLADLPAYLGVQQEAATAFEDYERWTRMAIFNTARVGKFSSDRTVRHYADEVWDIKRL